MTQAEASQALGWTHSVLGQYLTGHVACGHEAIFKIAELLKVTPFDLDPELRGVFTPPTEDLHDFKSGLCKMTRVERYEVIMTIAKTFSKDDCVETAHQLLALALGPRSLRIKNDDE